MKKIKKYEDGGAVATTAPAVTAPAPMSRDAIKSAIEAYKDSFKEIKKFGKGQDFDKTEKENYKNYLRTLTRPGELRRGLRTGSITEIPEIAKYNAEQTYEEPMRNMNRARPEMVRPARPAFASGSPFAGGFLKRKDPSTEVMGMKKGGSVSSASKRADGCAVRGKTKGRIV